MEERRKGMREEVRLMTCFCTSLKLRMFFIFFKVFKKKKKMQKKKKRFNMNRARVKETKDYRNKKKLV